MPLLGVDEVGRGPWAGPLVMGAVILDSPSSDDNQEDLEHLRNQLTDSKKLTKRRREILAPEIYAQAFATGLGWVHIEELNEIGLAAGLRTAARRAVAECLKNAGVRNATSYVDYNGLTRIPKKFPVSEVVIDGPENFLHDTPLGNMTSNLNKADLLIKEVSAASIIAKVARDDYMTDVVAKEYPGYGFSSHVGYGTTKHRAALERLGPCPEHRTFVRPVADSLGIKISKKTSNTSRAGQAAEIIVASQLKMHGHKILARDYKTKYYEIDIVSATKNHIYFTEVKYRQNKNHGSPLEAIDKKKYQQMTFAAESFMKYLAKRLNRRLETLPSPMLAAASVFGSNFTFEGWTPIV